MPGWRPAVEDYLQLRQNLGFKLYEARRALQTFAAFLDQRANSAGSQRRG